MKKLSNLLLALASILMIGCSSGPTRVIISTEYGDMVVELRDDTPQHKANFLKLIDEQFYDDLLFHRVMPGFMIQGGDPDSRDAAPGQPLGMGGPGYTTEAEFTGGLHIKGALAAARQPDQVNPKKASSGSQFYIVAGQPIDTKNLDMHLGRSKKQYTESEKTAYIESGAGVPFLDDEYTVFGQVVQGMEVIDKIANQQRNAQNRPNKDIKMTVKRG